MGTTAVTIAERVKLSASGAPVKRQVADVRDLVVVTPRQSRRWQLSALVRDVVRIRSSGTAGSILRVVLRSTAQLGVAMSSRLPVALRSGVAFSTETLVRQGVTVVERLRLRAGVAALGTYGRSITSRVRVTDHLPTMRLGALLRETFRVAATVTGLRRVTARVAETAELRDVLTHKLMLIALVRDGVDMEDRFDGVRSIFAGFLSEQIDLIIDVVDPSGDVTTWAMNTRTGAVSEYLNYAFNSFATSHDGTYLGADSDGLYELVGVDDAGTPVVADVIGGLVDMGGSFLSGMQAAYLGIRGKGQFYLRLTAGTGQTYLYSVVAQSLRVARIDIGKGLRARYFTYELISTGQDFDLTDIVFLPLQFGRKI